MPKLNSSIKFRYGEDRLTVADALSLAIGDKRGRLNPIVKERINKSAACVRDIVKTGRTVYGINTGFGSLCRTAISARDTEQLQNNLLRSHSVGVGEPIPLET